MPSSLIPIIGLEVHFELKTKSKMFCSCPADHFRKKANTQVCPVCLGLPGAQPIPNEQAINKTIMFAQVFSSDIDYKFMFDRKNYYYPDLPKGYQISQHFNTIGKGGKVVILDQGKFISIPLQDIHLEEDTAKLIHKDNYSLVDYNRSGVPLVEIVSMPSIHSPLQAKEYLKRIRQVARWLDISDCDMEKGSMRLEANISLTKNKKILPKYKIEIKNLNSFRYVEKALEYEIERQSKLLEKGEIPIQETRGFDSSTGKTFSQRSKEEAKDYRYFPEPDIPPFDFTNKEIPLPEGWEPPWQEEKTLIDKYGLDWKYAKILAANKKLLNYFKEAVKSAKGKIEAKSIANVIINKKISWKSNPPRELINKILTEKKDEVGGKKLENIVIKVIKNNPSAVQDYQSGKTQAIGFLIGQVQKETKGKAQIKQAKDLLIKLLLTDTS